MIRDWFREELEEVHGEETVEKWIAEHQDSYNWKVDQMLNKIDLIFAIALREIDQLIEKENKENNEKN